MKKFSRKPDCESIGADHLDAEAPLERCGRPCEVYGAAIYLISGCASSIIHKLAIVR
jgi:hypothetical protein